MITHEQIMNALSQVQEPDLNKDLVTLNMIKDVTINGLNVGFTVVLTTPACPLKDEIKKACENAILLLINKEAKVSVKFTSQVKTQQNRSDLNLPDVKNIIAVASGKGGVGKSSVAVNLAIALKNQGAKVGILDADIYGPSIPMLLGIQGEKPMMQNVNGVAKIIPIEHLGLKALSIGNLIDEKQAVLWRGAMASTAIKQFITDVNWGELDYLILDLPPGTGDIHLTLLQLLPITGALIVTTPQKVAVADSKKAIMMFDTPQLKVPILGIVENMAYFTPKELPENKYYIFGKNYAKQMADQFDIPILQEIPIYEEIGESNDSGSPLAENNNHFASEIFKKLSSQVAQKISILHFERKA